MFLKILTSTLAKNKLEIIFTVIKVLLLLKLNLEKMIEKIHLSWITNFVKSVKIDFLMDIRKKYVKKSDKNY